VKSRIKPTKGEKSRSAIIEQAAVLFNKRGFDGCSIQDIVGATGFEKGSIYGHFSSKEELALAAFDFAWEVTLEKRFEDLDEIADAVDKLRKHVDNFVETMPSFPGGCPLLNSATASYDGNTALRTRSQRALDGWIKKICLIIEDGKSRKEIRESVDARQVAMHVISLLGGSAAMDRVSKKPEAIKFAQRHLKAYFESDVRINSPKRRRPS
jgi:TetR/AcrR family transcriptional repressor of nem operon